LAEFKTKSFALCALLALSGAVFADHDEAYQLVQQGKILPLGQIIELQRREQPGRILEVQLIREDDRLVYLLEVLDRRGRVWQLFYDAATGDTVGRSQEP
jgi:uncharacterized membrane protein YkoI